jgi:hypothetical protein
MKKTTLLFAVFLTVNSFIFAQFTAVPNVIFETYLVNAGIDTVGAVDGQILTIDANNYNGVVNTFNLQITDFTGIEAFTSMVGINVAYNSVLTTLDLSNNTALTVINAESTTSLNDLNVTGLNLVTVMNLFDNDLSVLDVSTNSALETLDVRLNNLTDLDLSANTAFISLNGNNNALTSLDVRNGNNANIIAFDSDFNNDLTCIFVDDSSAPYLSSWSIDSMSVFANDQAECNTLSVVSQELVTFNMFPNPTRNSVNVISSEQNSVINIYNITGKLVLSAPLNYGKNTLNVSKLSTGVYLARISSDNTTETKKLIIN